MLIRQKSVGCISNAGGEFLPLSQLFFSLGNTSWQYISPSVQPPCDLHMNLMNSPHFLLNFSKIMKLVFEPSWQAIVKPEG